VRAGQLRHINKYSRSVRQSFERRHRSVGIDVPLPTLLDAQSRIAVPAMVRGELVGVLVVESPLSLAFEEEDESVLTVVAALLAQMVDVERSHAEMTERAGQASLAAPATLSGETHIHFFAEDGSIFLDGEYLIRGVAGRILWSVLQRHVQTGQTEFANKELRLDRSLELPGFRDNLDTRLVMLKRRLDERDAPLRLDRIG